MTTPSDSLPGDRSGEPPSREPDIKPFTDTDTGKRIKPKLQGWRLNAVNIVAEADIV